MVQVGLAPRVHMGHEVEHPVALQHALARQHRNVMARLDGEGRIHLQMGVHHNHVAHLARAHIVHAAHARRLQQRLANGLHFLFVHRSVHQVVQRIPAKLPAHLGHHEAHDERGNGVQDGITRQVARNADAHHQRRSRIRARVPGIGHQHARLDALGHGQHVAKQQFFAHQRGTRHPQGDHMHLRNGLGVLQLDHRRPHHAHAHAQQQQAQHQRSRRLEAVVAVRVALVRVFLGVVVGKKHHEISHQVGQRVDAVGYQALRLGQHPHHDLDGGQHQVDAHADPGAARCGGRALRGGVLGVFGVVRKVVEFHGAACGEG